MENHTPTPKEVNKERLIIVSILAVMMAWFVSVAYFVHWLKGDFYERQELAEIHITIEKKPLPGEYEYEIKKCPQGIDAFIECKRALQSLRDDI